MRMTGGRQITLTLKRRRAALFLIRERSLIPSAPDV
jgi:hypothetical protein